MSNRYDRQRLRAFVRIFYDFQDVRLRTAGRVVSADPKTKAEGRIKIAPLAVLTESDVELIGDWSGRIERLEAEALNVIRVELRRDPVWTGFLKDVPGVGPTMGAVLLGGGFDIEKEDTASKMWSYCGLNPDSKRVAGEKLKYNPHMKAKIVGVLADCIMKANVRGVPQDGSEWHRYEHPWMVDEKGAPAPRWVKSYARLYFDYRHRKQSQIVTPCMLCHDTGKAVSKERGDGPIGLQRSDEKTTSKSMKCWNCDGGAHPAPWGKGDAHRHRAALRYMMKMFLLDFWKFWRESEGLPVCEPYYVEKLGMPPHHEGK